MGPYQIYRLEIEKKGRLTTRHHHESVVNEVPEGAYSMQALRVAEVLRAENAHRMRQSAIGSLMIREDDQLAKTQLFDLTKGLPDGAVVYEELSTAAEQ